MARGSITVRVIASCLMLGLLLSVAACDLVPGPPPPTPRPTAGGTPPAIVAPAPLGTPSPGVNLKEMRPLRRNPLVRMRAADLAEPLRPLVDRTYCAPAWSSNALPATIALPVEPVTGDLLLEWNSSGTSDYMSRPGAPTYGLPASYTISISADSTDGRNGVWLDVVRVTGNLARTRAHRFPYAGARWVRMTVTGAVPGPLGNEVAIDEIELHNASGGTDDSVFFLGDSITAAAFARCPANQPSFAELVHQAAPERSPIMMDGGVGGVTSSYGEAVIEDWLTLNADFNIWAIAYGTNDAWQKVSPTIFEAQMQAIVDRIGGAGRIPVIARIPFALKGPADADIQSLNQVVDLITTRNRLLPGPDLYSWFKAHPDELGPDGVHPSAAGTRSINRLWYEAMRPLYSRPEPGK